MEPAVIKTNQGLAGPAGPESTTPGPANVLTIGTVQTIAPGESASAEVVGESPSQVLNLAIPQGATGETGPQGIQGAPADPAVTNALSNRTHALEVAQAGDRLGYLTLAALQANLAPTEGKLAEVTNDATVANNGLYIKQGASGAGSWLKSTNDLPGRVSNVEQAQTLLPTKEDLPGLAAVHVDLQRRPWMKLFDDGTAWVNLTPASLPVIEPENLSDSMQSAFPLVDDITGAAVVHRDQNGRPFMVWLNDGTVRVKHAAGSINSSALASGAVTGVKVAPGAIAFSHLSPDLTGSFPAIEDFNDYIFVARDLNGRPLWAVTPEGKFVARIASSEDAAAALSAVTTAAGTAGSLNERISGVITPAGRLDRHHWGEWLLRSFGWKRTRLEAGQADRLSICCIGDSWTHNPPRLTQPLSRKLKASLGDGGAGFFGFGFFNTTGAVNGCADSSEMTGNRSPEWSQAYDLTNGVFALDGTHIYTTTPGLWVVVNVLKVQDSMRIHYAKRPGGGSFQYRIGSGSWTTVSTDGPVGYGLETVTIPATTYTLRIEVLDPGTAGVILNGVDGARSAGAVVHKLGQSGGTARNFITYVNEAYFSQGLATLAPDLVTIMFATNEQSGNTPPATLAENMVALAQRVRAARPLCDVILMCPAQNGMTGKTFTMAQYRDAIYGAAVSIGAGFVDLTKVFGGYDTYKSSSDGSTRNLFASDEIHPNTDGAAVMSDAIYRFFYSL